MIASGLVAIDGEIVSRSNQRVLEGSAISISPGSNPFVSRGGQKLSGALSAFQINPAGRVCLDIGISTGGFSDCLLQLRAARVVGVDVGHGQLHPKLLADRRLELREGVNARRLSIDDFGEKFSLIVVDVSFISLTLILPVVPSLLDDHGDLICLIKPQFEVGAGRLGKNGVVTDAALQEEVRGGVHQTAENLGLLVAGSIESPIIGGDGNREFLSHFKLVNRVALPSMNHDGQSL